MIRAQIAARAIFGAAGLDKAIAALDHQIDAQMQTTLRMAVRTLVERASLADQQPASRSTLAPQFGSSLTVSRRFGRPCPTS